MAQNAVSDDEMRTGVVRYYLRHPRGNYVAKRASQLSGVPVSTIYYWRKKGVYVPDFSKSSPVPRGPTGIWSTCACWRGCGSSAWNVTRLSQRSKKLRQW